jgi:transcription elongation factor Elf1
MATRSPKTTVQIRELGSFFWNCQLSVDCPKCEADAEFSGNADNNCSTTLIHCQSCQHSQEIPVKYSELVKAILLQSATALDSQSTPRLDP